MDETFWLTAASVFGELFLSYWEIDSIFPSIREMIELLLLWELSEGVPDGGAASGRVARGLPPPRPPPRSLGFIEVFVGPIGPVEGLKGVYDFI